MVQEKIEQSTDVLKAIISPVMNEGEDAMWPPRNPEALKLMEKVITSLLFYRVVGFHIIIVKCDNQCKNIDICTAYII